mgnify:CR=1 FL=1
MKNMLPKGFSTFLKNPDMPKLVCVVVAVFLAVLILRYFKVIEGMANGMMSDIGIGEGFGHGGGGRGSGRGGGHSDKPPKETMLSSSDLMAKIGMK